MCAARAVDAEELKEFARADQKEGLRRGFGPVLLRSSVVVDGQHLIEPFEDAAGDTELLPPGRAGGRRRRVPWESPAGLPRIQHSLCIHLSEPTDLVRSANASPCRIWVRSANSRAQLLSEGCCRSLFQQFTSMGCVNYICNLWQLSTVQAFSSN